MAHMTGPEHYKAAEQCLEFAEDQEELRDFNLAAAQVHATLALAAATVLSADETKVLVAQRGRDDWYEAIVPRNEDA